MDKLYKIDQIINHTFSTSRSNRPTFFEWQEYQNNSDYVFLTDFSVNAIDNLNNKKVFVWIIESPAVSTHAIEYLKHNHGKFAKIYTSDKDLLSISDKFKFIPVGGCWVNSEDRIIHNKNKLISIITSDKNWLRGHNLRNGVVHYFRHMFDVFGYGYNPIPNKIEGLKDYMFSIAIENCQSDYYFTEKLIDCFVTGTIPIYWGCPSISKFFNVDGILEFNNIEELYDILNKLTPELYDSKKSVIEENYKLSKQYLVADDILYDEFSKEFLN